MAEYTSTGCGTCKSHEMNEFLLEMREKVKFQESKIAALQEELVKAAESSDRRMATVAEAYNHHLSQMNMNFNQQASEVDRLSSENDGLHHEISIVSASLNSRVHSEYEKLLENLTLREENAILKGQDDEVAIVRHERRRKTKMQQNMLEMLGAHDRIKAQQQTMTPVQEGKPRRSKHSARYADSNSVTKDKGNGMDKHVESKGLDTASCYGDQKTLQLEEREMSDMFPDLLSKCSATGPEQTVALPEWYVKSRGKAGPPLAATVLSGLERSKSKEHIQVAMLPVPAAAFVNGQGKGKEHVRITDLPMASAALAKSNGKGKEHVRVTALPLASKALDV